MSTTTNFPWLCRTMDAELDHSFLTMRTSFKAVFLGLLEIYHWDDWVDLHCQTWVCVFFRKSSNSRVCSSFSYGGGCSSPSFNSWTCWSIYYLIDWKECLDLSWSEMRKKKNSQKMILGLWPSTRMTTQTALRIDIFSLWIESFRGRLRYEMSKNKFHNKKDQKMV